MISVILFFLLFNNSVVKTGDDAFIKQQYDEAIGLYESTLPSSENKAEVLWRIARCYISIGDVAKKEEREKHYRKAEFYASRAVKEDSLNSDAHCWRAIAIGYVAMYEGVRAKVQTANEIKRELDAAIRLNPNNDVAYSILGTFYRTLGNVSWIEKQLANLLLGGLPPGGYTEAEQALKKAIELAPTIIRHRFELGQLYLDMDKPDEAKKVFQSAINLPPVLASDTRRIERMKRKIEEL
jgi:hypothetical protein